MKIVIFSDSHGQLRQAQGVLEQLQDRVDMVFHLGDHDSDAALLQKSFPKIPFHKVKGNNDFSMETPSTQLVRACGRCFLLTHGHRQKVSWSYDTLSYWAEEQGADMVVFGHTHVAYNDAKGRVHLFNPGSISQPRDSHIPTFGIVTIEHGRIEGAIMEYLENGTIQRRR